MIVGIGIGLEVEPSAESLFWRFFETRRSAKVVNVSSTPPASGFLGVTNSISGFATLWGVEVGRFTRVSEAGAVRVGSPSESEKESRFVIAGRGM